MTVVSVTHPRTCGPTIIPASISAVTIGRRNLASRRPRPSATAERSPRLRRNPTASSHDTLGVHVPLGRKLFRSYGEL